MVHPDAETLADLMDRFRRCYQALAAGVGECSQAAHRGLLADRHLAAVKQAIVAMERELKHLREAVGFDLADDIAATRRLTDAEG